MVHLYIGNVTKQIHYFAYRAPEHPGVITQIVPIGGQVRIAPNGQNTDLSPPEIEVIIGQHRMYGIQPVDELDTSRGSFSGLVYSIGKPISEDKLRKAMKKLENQLEAQGRKLRNEAALAVNSQIERQIGAPLRQLEMSFAEEEPRGGYSDDLNPVAEGIRVTREADVAGPVPITTGQRSR